MKRSIVNTTAQPKPVQRRQQSVTPAVEPTTASTAKRQNKPVADATDRLTSSAPQLTASSAATVERKPAESTATSKTRDDISRLPKSQAKSDRQVRQPKTATTIAKQVDLAAAARRSTALNNRLREIVPLPTSSKQMATSQTSKQPNARQSELSAAAGTITRRPQQSLSLIHI